jgi:Domain of unknown function (DUF4936)
MRELFVYYRVADAVAAAADAAVRRLQAGLCDRHDGLQARLLRRQGDPGGLQTWMEIYARPGQPGGVTPSLQAKIERAAEMLAPLIDGPRHCEVFEPA